MVTKVNVELSKKQRNYYLDATPRRKRKQREVADALSRRWKVWSAETSDSKYRYGW
jgi:hypothetical protein